MPTKYAVKAETLEGKIMTLRGGFATQEAAEDHPVTMSLWKRVWVEAMAAEPLPAADLPPRPWDWVTSGTVSSNGLFNAYLVDANGRKLAAIWGKGREKEMIADHIIALVNGAKGGTMTEWQPIETAPKDGTEVILPLTFSNGVRAYWDGELKTWVLSRPLHIESLHHPDHWRSVRGGQ